MKTSIYAVHFRVILALELKSTTYQLCPIESCFSSRESGEICLQSSDGTEVTYLHLQLPLWCQLCLCNVQCHETSNLPYVVCWPFRDQFTCDSRERSAIKAQCKLFAKLLQFALVVSSSQLTCISHNMTVNNYQNVLSVSGFVFVNNGSSDILRQVSCRMQTLYVVSITLKWRMLLD
jgi:hypothetical protein